MVFIVGHVPQVQQTRSAAVVERTSGKLATSQLHMAAPASLRVMQASHACSYAGTAQYRLVQTSSECSTTYMAATTHHSSGHHHIKKDALPSTAGGHAAPTNTAAATPEGVIAPAPMASTAPSFHTTSASYCSQHRTATGHTLEAEAPLQL
jgi:hypothetical protein